MVVSVGNKEKSAQALFFLQITSYLTSINDYFFEKSCVYQKKAVNLQRKLIDTMRKSLIILFIIAVCCACHQRSLCVVEATTEAIPIDASADGIQDAAYLAQLAPIKEDLEREMNVQIGYAAEALWVGAPECPMLNWASDALWEAAKNTYDGRVDIAIVNMGGMRCSWPVGPITRGNIFVSGSYIASA